MKILTIMVVIIVGVLVACSPESEGVDDESLLVSSDTSAGQEERQTTPVASSTLSTPIEPDPTPKLTPEIVSDQCLLSLDRVTVTDQNDGDLYLQETETWQVIYLISDGDFLIRISGSFEESKKAAEDWFSMLGCSLNDLCILSVTFASLRGVNPDYTDDDAYPSGCGPIG